MSEGSDQGIRHHGHRRSQKRLRLILLALGTAGLVLGVVLLVWSFRAANARFRLMGVVYVLGSLILLGVRAILVELRRESKRKKL